MNICYVIIFFIVVMFLKCNYVYILKILFNVLILLIRKKNFYLKYIVINRILDII